MKRNRGRVLRVSAGNGNDNGNGNGNGNGKRKISPQQLAVVVGLLSQALSVDSVMIDKDQNIEIVLGGSLRKQTQMDRLLGEMSELSIGDLLDSIKNM
jgi:hypothetical protein